jgi:hypothetical protein
MSETEERSNKITGANSRPPCTGEAWLGNLDQLSCAPHELPAAVAQFCR